MMSESVRSFTPVIRSLRAGLLGLFLAALAALLAAGPVQAAKPAIFKAGAAAVNINPDSPQYPGGYGYKAGPFQEVNDPLEVRAFMVGQGKQAAVLVSADSTGWFSGYQGPVLSPYGIDQTRAKIATELNGMGYEIGPENVIINSTHSHSTPVLVGIWGTVDWKYLKKVSTGAVTAAVQAANKAKKSELWAGVGSVRSLVWQNGQGTNHPDGFEADNQLPVLWARDPKTGATNALYANIPNHPDEFRASRWMKFSADAPGYVRKVLDERNGGTAVIASGTLGRQEPPGSVDDYSEVIPQGEFDANQIQQTMADATPVMTGGIAASQRRFTTPADNDDLLTLINGFIGAGSCIDEFEYCTIPRSRAPEYFSPADGGNPATVTATTHAIRIGNVLIASNPGEAFPEVNRAIRESIHGPRQIHVAALTDMLGYYYRRSDYGPKKGNIIGSSNFNTYNVGPDLGQDNAEAAVQAASELGYQTDPPTVAAQYDPTVAGKPGIQWYPNRTETADPTVSIYGSATKSQIQKEPPTYNTPSPEAVPAPATIQWDFGDGTTGTTADEERFDHTFPGPGSYEVTATVSGTNALSQTFTRSWTDTITIDPPLTAKAKLVSRTRGGGKGIVVGTGGNARLVAASWTCPNGKRTWGLTVTCPGAGAGLAGVTVVDGAGNTATAKLKIPAAARVRPGKTKFKNIILKRGEIGDIRIPVRNAGGVTAAGVKVCAGSSRVARPVRKCVSLGSVKAGKTGTARLKLRGLKPGSATLKLTITSGNAGKASARVKVRVR